MNKNFIAFILICLILGGITGCNKNEEYTPTPQPTLYHNTIAKNPEDIMLYPFEDENGDESLYKGPLQSLDLTNAPWHQFVVEPSSISHHTDTGNGFKMPLNYAPDVWYQILRASTSEEYKTNFDNCKYLRIWVSNVGKGTLSLGVLLSAGMYYFSFLNADKAVITSSNGTLLDVEKVFTVDKFIPEAVEHGPDSVVLPAGFSGWVAFPLLEETVDYWTSSPVENLSQATTIDLRILSESEKTEYYVIDDICLTNHEKGTIRFK